MEFKKFRISGFKSFAEPAELEIFNGLTGIVGPNGCGKSNLVESLRWAMGEASSKSLRSGQMDDVIFAGTSLRAARDIAEVSIVLNNSQRDAPAPYTEQDIIEISRHIEREAGSHYQINGQETRARDVNMFFADLLGGAHSSALVGQGRIDQIILSKPKERRRILEEAAGITGLHARKHEAQLRLKRADDNLAKLADNIKQTETRLRQLKKQATQAERYRKASKEIERIEALRLWIRWNNAQNELTQEEQKLAQEKNKTEGCTKTAAQTLQAETQTEKNFTAAREKATEATSAYERLEGQKTLLEREARDTQQKIAVLKRTQQELQDDIARTKEMIKDAQEQIAALDQEGQHIINAEAEHEQEAQRAQQNVAACQDNLAQAEQIAETTAKKRADWKGNILSLEQKLNETHQRLTQTQEEEADIVGQLQEFADFDDDHQEVNALKQQAHAAHEAARHSEDKLYHAEKTRADAEQYERHAHEQLGEARDEVSKRETEAHAMGKLFADIGNHPGKAVIDLIKGGWFGRRHLDMAMAAALGDDLMASLEEGSASFWQPTTKKEKRTFFFRRHAEFVGDSALPSRVVPLSKYIRKPDVLRRRLAQTGLVDAARGAELQTELKPGQRLVSREGHLWRWDGYVADPRIAQATLNRLAEWRKFSALEAEAGKARSAQHEAAAHLEQARHDLEAASRSVDAAKAQRLKDNEHKEQTRNAWQEAAATISTAMARKATLDEAARRIKEEKIAATQLIAKTEENLNAIKQNTQPQQQEDQARAQALEARDFLSAAKEAQTLIAQNITKRQQRQSQIAESRANTQKNRVHLDQQMESLTARHKAAQQEQHSMDSQPQEIAVQIQSIDDKLTAANQNRAATQQALTQAEAQYNQSRQQTRQAEKILADARENLARQETIQENAQRTLAERRTEIENKYHRAPENIPAWVELENDSPIPELAEIEETLTRLEDERTRIGAPNLQAEEERKGMIDEYETMKAEADDLEKAINRLRRGISTLNREGRERLLEAFEQVNTHFKALFKKLFGGGSARLELVEDEDPLEAGLEIIARPPGKAVQHMSLLSGGEKALTAISLLFAAFKTRPAPICVLDEVDAPLDDRNVQRFCDLLDEMTHHHQTRFLVITHHAITLSRMDRLYGVTMEEEGVSRIVSVELAEAEDMREPLQAVS